MSSEITVFDKRTPKYLELAFDQQKLIKSSISIIRKKKSYDARQINKGDVNTIKRASISRVFGSLPKQSINKICKIICDLMKKLDKRKETGKTVRELVAWAISSILGFIEPVSGLMIGLLWVLKEKLGDALCPCNLKDECLQCAN